MALIDLSLIFLLSFTGCCVGSNILPDGPVDVILGKHVTLNILYAKKPEDTIVWGYSDGKYLTNIVTLRPTGLQVNAPYKGRVAVNTNGYLTINSLKSEDSGYYSLNILTGDGPTLTGEIKVRVLPSSATGREKQTPSHTTKSPTSSANSVLGPIAIVMAVLVIITNIVLLVMCIVIKSKKRELSTEVSVYNPGNTNVHPGPIKIPEGCEDGDHLYTTIDDSLVYSHLLHREKNGVYNEYDSYQTITEPKRTPVYDKVSDDSNALLFQPQQSRPLSNTPPSSIDVIVDNSIYNSWQKNQEEHLLTPPPKETKGGN